MMPRIAVGHSCPIVFSQIDPLRSSLFVASLSSFALDFAARQKIGGLHLTYGYFNQLPILPPTTYDQTVQWSDGAQSISGWLFPRMLELTYTAWDLQPFAQDCNYPGPPFRWDEERRFLLRCELDAAFFHLYLPAEANGDWRPAENETAEDRARLKASFPTPRAAVDYIMDTFPIVKRKDEAKGNGDYRTKRVILEIYDAMAEAVRTGIPYQTRLSPPAADAAIAHPWPVEQPQQVVIPQNAMDNLAQQPDSAWETIPGMEPKSLVILALIDVLQRMGTPVDAEKVRLATFLVRSPALATAFMDDAHAAEWIRVVGQDARPLRNDVIQISQFQKNAIDSPWEEAVAHLKGTRGLLISPDGKWLAGDKLPASSGEEWITGRAAIAVHLIQTVVLADAERKVIAFIRSVEDGRASRAVS
jgi:hypothetical protein